VLCRILTFCHDESIRKQVFIAGNTHEDELELLEQLLILRQKLARILGFKTFSHSQGWNRSLKSPELVLAFLDRLSNSTRPNANAQLQMLKSFGSKGDADTIQDWDVPYLMAVARGQLSPRISGSFKEYFTTEGAIDGFIQLCRELFNLDMKFEEPQNGEIWDPLVKKLVVRDVESAQLLGTVYIDLYHRRNKFSGAANFPIRFRTIHAPVARIALVCSKETPTRERPSLLSLEQLTTLWHELGHTLQTLLSQTKLQHFAGTRSLQDSVEIISLLFEHFARDYRILRRFGRHWRTGDVIPEKLLEDELRMSTSFGAIDLQNSIYFSALDQTLHGVDIKRGGTSEIAAKVKSKYTNIPYAAGTSQHARFSHLLSYPSTYYSYLASGVSSLAIWQKLFLDDPLSREAGHLLKTKFLAHGGTRNPDTMVRELIGEAPSTDAFIKSRCK
jgi:mitochondrial intermediate peptidase